MPVPPLHRLYRRLLPDDLRRTPAYRAVRGWRWSRRPGEDVDLDDVKLAREARYWHERYEEEGGRLQNDTFAPLFQAIAGEPDAAFVEGKVVADFGCGPRGSLEWAVGARARIGIDVLSEVYAQLGIRNHQAVYVCSTETNIPLPSGYVDVMFTVSALDHVYELETMCQEILRVMAPGGLLVASFDLHEPRTVAAPQPLTEPRLRALLLDHMDLERYRTALRCPAPAPYADMMAGLEQPVPPDRAGLLWVRARKR